MSQNTTGFLNSIFPQEEEVYTPSAPSPTTVTVTDNAYAEDWITIARDTTVEFEAPQQPV